MQAVRRSIRLASFVAVAILGTACGKITIPANLNFDSSGTNEIAIQALGQTLALPLVGGISANVTVDTNKIFSPSGLLVTIAASDVRIAGPSQTFLGLETGTLCVRNNANDPTVASALVKLGKPITADFHFGVEATSTLIASLVPGGLLTLSQDVDNAPLNIDFGKILKLQIDGAITSNVVLMGQLPANVPILGGAPYTLTASLASSLKKAQGPLIDECAPFRAGS
ncbi:MAG TPA: hypothetical protein VMW35_18585 [Myxococcota bacterium]|jgi:hypothetical protein|nr:hypothetical protein [Myxococcota bacterium]